MRQHSVRRISRRSGRFGFLRRGERHQPGEFARADERRGDRDGGMGDDLAAATIIALHPSKVSIEAQYKMTI